MALRQKTEENYDILLRSLELSNELLGKLRRVPFIKEKIQFIKQQKTTDKKNDALLTALLEVPENLQESVLNDFIAALKSSGQEHVANIIRKDSDTMFMSDEHYRLLNSKQRQLCQFLEPRDGLIDHLVSDEVFTSSNGDSVLEGMVLVDDMVRQTVKILLRKSDDSFDKFINALNETEQDHVVHILTGIGIPPMSTEHRNLLQSKKKKLEMFLDPINGVLSGLTELNAVSRRDEARIRVMTSIDEMAQELVDTLMRKPDNVFEGLTKALNKAEQSHVTYILTGEGDSRPVSEECRAKLREKRSVVVESIYSQCLVSTLISKGVFSSHDQRRVESQLTDTGKSEMMVDLISRKSQAAFNGFIDTLKQCHHEHVAEELMNPEIIGKIHPQVSAEKEAVGTDLTEVKLCEAMQHAFENETEVKHLNDVLIPNGISVSKITYGSIIVKFRCRDHAAIVSLQNLYTSRQLDQLFTNTFCPRFAENGVEAIRINIAKEEIDRHLELNLMTSEHREALESSAKWLVDKILTIDDKLLGKLSLCKRRRQAIERAGTPEQQVKTLLDIVARQPDSAFTQLLNALNTTDQREAAAIINGGYKQTTTSESSECESTEIRITHTEGAWKEFGQNMTYLLRAIHTLPTDYSLLVRLALYGVIKSLHALCQQGLVPTLRWWIAEELESPLSMLGMSSTRLSLPEKLESPKLKWILDLCRRPGFVESRSELQTLYLSLSDLSSSSMDKAFWHLMENLHVFGQQPSSHENELRRYLSYGQDLPLFDAPKVAAKMRQRNFLSSDELRLIKSQQDRPLEAARTLLKVLKDKSDAAWTCFVHCLLDTGETESDSAFCEEEVPGAKRRRLSSPTIGCDTSTHQQDCQIGSGGSPVSEASNQLEKMQVAGEDPFKLITSFIVDETPRL